jgi:hypothetical protein
VYTNRRSLRDPPQRSGHATTGGFEKMQGTIQVPGFLDAQDE